MSERPQLTSMTSAEFKAQTSIFIFQLLENSVSLSISALEDEQVLAEVTSSSSKAGLFLITGFYSSPVCRDANTSCLLR